MTRQQRRKEERARIKVKINVDDFRRSSPLAEAVYQQGYADGWKAACDFCMKTCYAASVLALHDLEGYGTTRNMRFLRLMDSHVTNTLSSEEIMDDALQKAGVAINFRAPFTEERIQDVEGK